MLDAQIIADRAWDALRASAVPPTPRSFAVFYTLISGTNRALTERVSALEAGGRALTPQYVEDIHRSCIDEADDADTRETDAEEFAETARHLVEQITDNGAALRQYGGALDHWGGHLNARSGVEGLLQAVTALTTETARASERNRALEAQLSSSVERINRLRQDLTEMRHEATMDALTGIANRRAFDARLRKTVRQAQTDPTTPFALLMLDVDHFKRFNDTHGHRTGDQVLRLVARLLADNVKGRDTAARFGGEEFAVLLAGADLMAATTVARQMCERLAAQRLIKRGTGEPIGQVTISIGRGAAPDRRARGGADRARGRRAVRGQTRRAKPGLCRQRDRRGRCLSPRAVSSNGSRDLAHRPKARVTPDLFGAWPKRERALTRSPRREPARRSGMPRRWRARR